MGKKILLLGATGRTGKRVLEEAIRQGFHVNCLGRNITRIEKRENVECFEGDPRSKSDLLAAIQGCQFVINTLNISRESDFPWSRLRTPETYLAETMFNVEAVASMVPLLRIVACSAWGVSESRIDIPWWFKWMIENSNINAAYIDHERQEEILKRSNLPWTIVRPVGLTNGRSIQKVRETFGVTPWPRLTINRLSLAGYLVQAITNEQLLHEVVVVSKD